MKAPITTLALTALALTTPAMAQSGFAKAREDITRWCEGDAQCVADQRAAMGRFVVMMAAFRDPERQMAETCMTAAKSRGGIDWIAARDCLRAKVEGRNIGN